MKIIRLKSLLFKIYFKLYLILFVPIRISGGGKSWKGQQFSVIGGLPDMQIRGKLVINKDASITMVNNSKASTLGIARPCKLFVYKGAELHFKGIVGMSNTVIVATRLVEIGNNVMIGGGATIVDCDFHSMDYNHWFSGKDEENMVSRPVIIGNNVFIGTNATILKGVSIGDGAVIGAGAVVTRNIPKNEIWGGNPARFIKSRE